MLGRWREPVWWQLSKPSHGPNGNRAIGRTGRRTIRPCGVPMRLRSTNVRSESAICWFTPGVATDAGVSDPQLSLVFFTVRSLA